VRESVLLLLDRVQLTRLRAVSRDLRTWVRVLLLHIGLHIRTVDVRGGVQTRVLRRLTNLEVADEGDEILLCAGLYDLTGGDSLVLIAKGLKLVGEAGGEQPEIRRDVGNEYVVFAHNEGIEITNIKVNNRAAERSAAVSVLKGGIAEVQGCDARGSMGVLLGGTLLLQDSRVHHSTGAGVLVEGITDIQDTVVEDNEENGIDVGRPRSAAPRSAATAGAVCRC